MPRMSQSQYDEFLARSTNRQDDKQPSSQHDNPADQQPQGEEAQLQNKIKAYCNSLRWLCVSGSPVQRTHRSPLGEPDLYVWLPGGVLICAELKTRTGKLSDDQFLFHRRAEMLGYHIP